MKKLLLLFATTFSFLFLKAQTSTITGSVIVNFNYTRNDPDVGDEISLFNINKKYSLDYLDRDSVKKTTTDIEGKYILKNIPAGEYIIYINSKGATADPFFLFHDLTGYLSKKLKNITGGFDFSTHRTDLQTEINSMSNESLQLAEQKKWKKYNKLEKETNKKIDEWIGSLPDGIKLFLNIYGSKMAKEFKEITVKPGVDENYTSTFKVLFN